MCTIFAPDLFTMFNSTGIQKIPFEQKDYIIVKHRPVICVHEPENESVKRNYNTTKIATEAIDEWVTSLERTTGAKDDRWKFNIIVTSSTENKGKTFLDYRDQCDIQINYELYDSTSSVRSGYATSAKDESGAFQNIVIYTSNVSVGKESVTTSIYNNKLVKQITMHELGHAFGLLHYENSNKNFIDFNPNDAQNSLMYPSFSQFFETTFVLRQNDIDAVVALHTEDGWGGKLSDKREYIFP